MNDTAYLTIEERIELYKKNMAFSPSDAARKVISLAETSMSDIIDDDIFLEKDNSRRYRRSAMYREFCRKLSSAVSKELGKTNKSPYESRFGNNYSDYIYIAALCLASLPDRLEEDSYNVKPSIYYDLRMTLGNYLDALIDISCDAEKGKPDTRRATRYRKLKKELSKLIDLSAPLCEAIGTLLNQYSDSHAELDRLNHIQKCKADLDHKLQMDEMREEYLDYEEDPWPDDLADSWADEEEYYSPSDTDEAAEDTDDETDDEDCIIETTYYEENFAPVGFVTDDDFGEYFDEDDFDEDFDDDDFDEGDDDIFDDDLDDDDPETIELRAEESLQEFRPSVYYLSEARKLPSISAQSPEKLYAMGNENPNLLADNDYSPEGIKTRIDAAELPPEFREVADEVITTDGIASAFKGMDAVTDKLYRLLIEPFAEIGKYRFERHLASDSETA